MRLLNTATIKLKEFVNPETVDYAILSHTWDHEEVSFQALQQPWAKGMAGYQKITSCCLRAASDGFDYVWIGTCCIDKTSSSELSEAINSMYQWYRNAKVCYTYLPDVPSDENPQLEDSAFAKSRWFTRGWTLQELLAPSTLVLYGKDWVEIGTKSSLLETISKITCIEPRVLSDNDASEISIATRMSWASKRETTRAEDMAYSLMGIFGVSMPIMYGEGQNSFMRLQRKIMKVSNDHSIFTWTADKKNKWEEKGLLARSPSEFHQSRNVQTGQFIQGEYSMTNQGLRIRLEVTRPAYGDTHLHAFLNCYLAGDENSKLGIYLRRLTEDNNGVLSPAGQHYARVFPDLLLREVPTPYVVPDIALSYVKEKDRSHFEVSETIQRRPGYLFKMKTYTLPDYGFHLLEEYPAGLWYERDGNRELLIEERGTFTALMFKVKDGEKFVVLFGVHGHIVWYDVRGIVGIETLEEIWISYSKNQIRGQTERRHWDQFHRFPLTGKPVSVAINLKGVISDRAWHLVEININAEKSPLRTSKI